MSDRKYFALLTCSVILILAACSPGDEATLPPSPAAEKIPAIISASGVVLPEQQALLSVSTGGIVEDVFVKKGDRVTSGEVLVKLKGSDRELAAVSAAELALLNAQLVLEALHEDTELTAAKALDSAEAAESALEDLNDTELQQAQALQAVADAEKSVADADRNLVILTNPPAQNALDQARGNILLAEKNLDEILEQIEDIEWQYKKYSSNKNLPSDIKKDILTKLRRALKGLEYKRSLEQLALNKSQTRYNDLLEPPDPVDVQVAEAELAVAQALLGDAERELKRVLKGPQAGEVALLDSQIERGRRDYEIYRDGPDPEDFALAEARITNAESQLAAAHAAIEDRQLLAPFDGVISSVHVNAGEWIAPGSPLLLVGKLEQLQVETTDLGEIDVAQIMVGDPAMVTFDSLPDLALKGTVSRIAPMPTEGSGVNYPVIIALDDFPAGLRWGMTAFVDIALD